INMYGIRMFTAGVALLRVTAPLYSPAGGTAPDNVTTNVVFAPAASVMLGWFTETVAPAAAIPVATAAASVTEVEPVLVMVSEIGAGSPTPDFKNPNERVAGSAVTIALTAALASKRPAPIHSTSTGSAKSSVATDRKSTRLNSSHLGISYAVFCLKK